MKGFFTENRQRLSSSGVYIILNKLNNRFYIGSSSNLYSRIKNHVNSAQTNYIRGHKIDSLNGIGTDNIEIEILITCKSSQILMYEYCMIDFFYKSKYWKNILNKKIPISDLYYKKLVKQFAEEIKVSDKVAELIVIKRTYRAAIKLKSTIPNRLLNRAVWRTC